MADDDRQLTSTNTTTLIKFIPIIDCSWYWQRSDHSDVVIRVGEGVYRLHKLILAAGSSKLREMLEGDQELNEVELSDLSAEGFDKIIRFLYGQSVDVDISSVQALYNDATLYGVPKLVEKLDSWLETNVTNYVDLLLKAKSNSNSGLAKSLINLIKNNYEDVSNSTKFVQLEVEDIKTIFNLESIEFMKSENVFMSAKKWIEFHLPSRQCHWLYFLQLLNFDHLPIDFICSYILKTESIYNIHEHLLFVTLQMTSREMFDDESDSLNFDKPICLISKKVYTIGGRNKHQVSGKVVTFDPDMVCEARVVGEIEEIYSHCSEAFEDKVIVFGGKMADKREHFFGVFDLNTQTFERQDCLKMRVNRSKFSSCSINDTVYALAGEIYNGKTSEVEAFDFNNQKWEPFKPLPIEVSDHNSTSIGYNLYVHGGYASVCSPFYWLDIREGLWSSLGRGSHQKVSYQRVRHTLLNNSLDIFAVGGVYDENHTRYLDVYDSRMDSWIHSGIISSPSNERFSHCSVFANNTIYNYGGITSNNGEKFVSNVETIRKDHFNNEYILNKLSNVTLEFVDASCVFI